MANRALIGLLGASTGLLTADPLLGPAAAAWEGTLNGIPEQMIRGRCAGYFLWYDGDGLHLRVHAGKAPTTFSGQVHTDGLVFDTQVIRPVGAGLTLDRSGQILRFHFEGDQYVDGIDWRVRGGRWLLVAAETNGHPALPRSIYLGEQGRHPRTSPFVLRR